MIVSIPNSPSTYATNTAPCISTPDPSLVKREDLVVKTGKMPERYEEIFTSKRVALPLVAIRYGSKWMVLTVPNDSQKEIYILPFFHQDQNHLFLLTLCNATWVPGCEPTESEKKQIVSHLVKKRWEVMEIVSATGIPETQVRHFIS